MRLKDELDGIEGRVGLRLEDELKRLVNELDGGWRTSLDGSCASWLNTSGWHRGMLAAPLAFTLASA